MSVYSETVDSPHDCGIADHARRHHTPVYPDIKFDVAGKNFMNHIPI